MKIKKGTTLINYYDAKYIKIALLFLIENDPKQIELLTRDVTNGDDVYTLRLKIKKSVWQK